MPTKEQLEMFDEMKRDNNGKASLTWKPPADKEGNWAIRILPPLRKSKGEKLFYFTHRVHWINRTPYECLDQSLNDKHGNFHEAERCPLCVVAKRLFESDKESDEYNMARKIVARQSYIYRVVKRGDESEETMPVFYESGKSVYEIIFHIILETDFGDITDPMTGRDFILTKKGTGERSRYDNSTPSPNSSPIFKDQTKLQEVLENAKKLDYNSIIEFKSVDDIKAAINDLFNPDAQQYSAPKTQKKPVESTPESTEERRRRLKELELTDDDDEPTAKKKLVMEDSDDTVLSKKAKEEPATKKSKPSYDNNEDDGISYPTTKKSRVEDSTIKKSKKDEEVDEKAVEAIDDALSGIVF